MLSANALDDLSWQVAEIFSKIFLNISRATLLAFVLDKLQTVGAIPSVKHQNLSWSWKLMEETKLKNFLTSQTSPSSPSAAGSAAASSVTTSASGISPSVRPGQADYHKGANWPNQDIDWCVADWREQNGIIGRNKILFSCCSCIKTKSKQANASPLLFPFLPLRDFFAFFPPLRPFFERWSFALTSKCWMS